MAASIEAWERFHESGDIANVLTSVPDVIADSWARSHDRGVVPDDLNVPHVEIDTRSAFFASAVPVLMGMSDLLADSSTSLALTDAAGTVVWRWDSEPDLTRALDASEVELGSSMLETTSGTNGIAVAAMLRRPATVIGAEHYKAAWHRWACAASPVFHPVTRDMVGVVNVACRAEDANHLLDVAVRSMAREIQLSLQSHATLPEQRLLAAHLRRRGATHRPVVSVNDKTLIVDDDGLRMRVSHSAIWAALRELHPDPGVLQIAPGVRARVHPIIPGRLDVGATLEVLLAEQDAPDSVSADDRTETMSELERTEMRVIAATLRRHRGNKLAAANELGISRNTLYSRIRRYRIQT